MKSALVITHVSFEDLGSLERELIEAEFEVDYIDACTHDLKNIENSQVDLLIILGGPIGVYEQSTYPFLSSEIKLIRNRLSSRQPTLGICLGAQLMAAALGARVYPGNNGKEIGWKPLQARPDAEKFPAMKFLLENDIYLLHWHGDTFDLPFGVLHLASTEQYPNQAFALGNYALALQFHPEVTGPGLEHWYVGHACELANSKIDIIKLRKDSAEYGFKLQEPAKQFWRYWLSNLGKKYSD